MIDDHENKCPNCGATNLNIKRTTDHTPKTIEELKQWYQDRNYLLMKPQDSLSVLTILILVHLVYMRRMGNLSYTRTKTPFPVLNLEISD